MNCSVCKVGPGDTTGWSAVSVFAQDGKINVQVGTPAVLPDADLMSCSAACQTAMLPMILKAVKLAEASLG